MIDLSKGLSLFISNDNIKIEIDKKYKPVLTVHDAIVCTAKKEEADEALNFVMDIMKRAPKWAPGLPVTCEGGHAENYGDC